MNDFTKNKIAFAVALLAALFTITPILSDIGAWGYEVFSLTLRVKHLYYFLSAILTLAVYIYGLQFLIERQFKQLRVTGDIFYAIALVSPPLYVSLYLITLFTGLLAKLFQAPGAADILKNFIAVLIGMFATELGRRIVKLFSKKDRQERVENIQKEEVSILARAKQLFNDGYYDVTIVECFKVIELTVRKSLVARDIPVYGKTFRDLIEKARHQELLSPENFEKIDQLRRLRNSISHSPQNTSITREQAEDTLATTDRILAAIESTLERDSRSRKSGNGEDEES